MGDVTLVTPLAQAEAPFVWMAFTGCAVAVSFLPLMSLLSDRATRRKWGETYGALPWAVNGSGAIFFVILNVLFLVLAALSYWFCRGGHTFNHRVFPAVSYYVTLVVFGLWSLPAAFGYRCLPTWLLLGAFGGFVTFTVAAFLSGTWSAGGIACGGAVALFGILLTWFLDSK